MDDLSRAEIVLLGSCALLCILACIYFWKHSDEDEWKASSLRNPKDAAKPIPKPTYAPGKKGWKDIVIIDHAPKDDKRSRFQKFVEYPIFFGYAGFAIGILIPALLLVIATDIPIEDSRYELFVFYGALLIWNLCFTQIFKFRLKLPLIPFPITWALIPLFAIGVWQLVFGIS